MRKLVLVAMMAALFGLGACAQHDPNLRLHDMRQLGGVSGGYDLSLKSYVLNEDGEVTLSNDTDPSMAGFVSRALAPMGLTPASGPGVKNHVEVHLLCANPRKADMSLTREAVRIPALAVGAGYSEDLHYWLPDDSSTFSTRSSKAGRATQTRQPLGATEHDDDSGSGASQLSTEQVPPCLGRALVLFRPVSTGPVQDVFVGRGTTTRCDAVEGCPVGACSNKLEREVVDLLENRF